MRIALNLPNFGPSADPRWFIEVARAAEAGGWDGLFVWDHIAGYPGVPAADPWTLLAAAATVTTSLRLGPMVTPLPRRRPWQVARQAATLDHLSGGRVVLGVGLGAPAEWDFAPFGEEVDDRVRAERLDEGLDVVTGLWRGEPFSYDGRHVHLDGVTFLPAPVQQPRIPVWVAASWPRRAPLERAARWDGVFPLFTDPERGWRAMTPGDVRLVVARMRELRGDLAGFDVSCYVERPAGATALSDLTAELAEAGATWWHVTPGFDSRPADVLALAAGGPLA